MMLLGNRFPNYDIHDKELDVYTSEYDDFLYVLSHSGEDDLDVNSD